MLEHKFGHENQQQNYRASQLRTQEVCQEHMVGVKHGYLQIYITEEIEATRHRGLHADRGAQKLPFLKTLQEIYDFLVVESDLTGKKR